MPALGGKLTLARGIAATVIPEVQQTVCSSVEALLRRNGVMHPDELAYYRERAFIERERASDPTIGSIAAEIHLKLAGLYERLVELEERDNPAVRVVEVGHPAKIGSPRVSNGSASEEEEQTAPASAAADR